MKRKDREIETWYKPPEEVVCPLCERPIPKDQQDAHHLIPKLKGGKETQLLHRICHKFIHAQFTEGELATKYNTVDMLLENSEIQKFVEWVKKKPDGFHMSTKMSNRKR